MDARRFVFAFVGVVFAGAAGVGCARAPDDAEARLTTLQSSGAELLQAADVLEERLLGNQAQMHLWQELARRHKRVSAIATLNHTEHLSQMTKLMEVQEQKYARRKKRSVEVAYSTSRTRPPAGKGRN